MSRGSPADQPAHRLLAEMGKRVLRPGGKELTRQLVDALEITAEDDVVEFGPGTGFTARLALGNGPRSYTGIERERETAEELREKLAGPAREIVVGDAATTGLAGSCADVVFGEAMLSMQSAEAKAEIVEEANRLLRPSGSYGIHELAIVTDGRDEETRRAVRRDLSRVMKVNARPLTEREWIELLEAAGFDVTWRSTAPTRFLEPRRVIDDEGIARTLKIGYNVLTHARARGRIRTMRTILKRHERHTTAIAIVAEKR